LIAKQSLCSDVSFKDVILSGVGENNLNIVLLVHLRSFNSFVKQELVRARIVLFLDATNYNKTFILVKNPSFLSEIVTLIRSGATASCVPNR
jgi:hypothetical protein